MLVLLAAYLYTHTHPFNGPLSGTTQVSQYQKGKTDLDFTEARDSEWHWHQLGHMQTICTSLQTDNHASTPPVSFLQAGCPSCHPTNSVNALKAKCTMYVHCMVAYLYHKCIFFPSCHESARIYGPVGASGRNALLIRFIFTSVL